MSFARITFAAHDMNAFAELGRITVEQWHAARPGPQDLDADNSVMLDLMSDEHTIEDEKFVHAETVAALLNWPVAEVIQRGRQAVARQIDEDRELLRKRPPTYPSVPRLSPDGTYYICDQCGREWRPGTAPGCEPCFEAYEERDRQAGARPC